MRGGGEEEMATSQSEHKKRFGRRADEEGSKAADRGYLGILEMQRRKVYRDFPLACEEANAKPMRPTDRGDAQSRTKKQGDGISGKRRVGCSNSLEEEEQ